MNKLLLLAILGLALGGGVWKAQHPDGTLDDLKVDALTTYDNVKNRALAGFDAATEQPENATREANLEDRLAALEQSGPDADELIDSVNEEMQNKFAQTTESLQKLESENTEIREQLNSLNSSIAKDIAPAAGEAETVAETVAETAAETAALKASAEAGNVRLGTIEQRLDLLVRRINEQDSNTELANVNRALQDLQARLIEVDDITTASVSSANDARADLEEKIQAQTLRINTLAATQSDRLADRLASRETETTTAGDSENSAAASNAVSGAALAALSVGIDERLSNIENRLNTVNSDSRRIEALTEQLANAEQKITELEQQGSDTEQKISSLDSSVSELQTTGESLSIDTVQAEIQQQLATLQLQMESTDEDNNTAELVSQLSATRGRIQTLEQRVQELPASSSAAEQVLQTQTELETQIADLTRQLDTLSSTDPALQSTVQDVKQQVAELSAQGFVTQEELQAQQASKPIEYKIYFDRNSTDITDDAGKVLNSFITQEQNRTTGVSIYGFTDRLGSAAYNQQLALQRATNVRSYLITNGFDFTKIKALNGLGEDAAAAVLPDNAGDAQQRVVVLFAEQP